jgi:hypothetical protein
MMKMKKIVTMLVLAIIMMAGVSYGQTVTNDASLSAAVISFATTTDAVDVGTTFRTKMEIVKAMVPKVRAKMRADGVTFVGTAGRSNLVARVDAISAVLNAGSCEGMEAVLRDHDVTCADQDRTAQRAVVAALITEVMNGTVPTKKQRGLIHLVLGTVEYEKWRVAYNDGSSYTVTW